jgi:hypothetical protein
MHARTNAASAAGAPSGIQAGVNLGYIFKNKDDHYHLSLSYYIGVDWIPDTNQPIYVAPKLNTKLKEDGTQDNNINIEDIKQTDYLKMLFSALKHPEVSKYTDELFEIKWDSPQIEITQQQDLLTPLLVIQFLLRFQPARLQCQLLGPLPDQWSAASHPELQAMKPQILGRTQRLVEQQCKELELGRSTSPHQLKLLQEGSHRLPLGILRSCQAGT